MLKNFPILVLLTLVGCSQIADNQEVEVDSNAVTKGGLVTTQFQSFEELKNIIDFEYSKHGKPWVQIAHQINTQKVVSLLQAGISERDIEKARDGNFWKKIALGIDSPYLVANRRDLLSVSYLARRYYRKFGEGDIAFYDLAEAMVSHFSEEYLSKIPEKDFSDKGYINTFNHITAQAFMTVLFSEKLADFVADLHERANLKELITGKFSEEQLADIENGPVDNYVDMINNEWGQELGKKLKTQFSINRETIWTPKLLANFLNEIQSYFSWAFDIGFQPFRVTDEIIIRFSNKINQVLTDEALM